MPTSEADTSPIKTPNVAPLPEPADSLPAGEGNESWFRRFFGKSWWAIALWMFFLCFLLLLTLLTYRFLSGWLSQELTWEGFERFATSPFATAVGALGAALIAGTAVVLTLSQNKNVEASKSWWETFEWAAERARPLKKENEALPYGTAIDILSPLMDDAFGGRRLGRRAVKSWDLRKQACGSIIRLLNEPYAGSEAKVDNESGTSDQNGSDAIIEPTPAEPNVPAPTEDPTFVEVEGPASSEEPNTPPVSKSSENHSSKKATYRDISRRRSSLGAPDLKSVQNFIQAHPTSQAAVDLSAVHYEALLMDHLSRLLPDREGIRILRNVRLSEIPGLGSIGDGEADAVLIKDKHAVFVEVKQTNGMYSSRFLDVLRKESQRAKQVWVMSQIPTLLITDFSDSEARFKKLSREYSTEYFKVFRWTTEDRVQQDLSEQILNLLTLAPRVGGDNPRFT